MYQKNRKFANVVDAFAKRMENGTTFPLDGKKRRIAKYRQNNYIAKTMRFSVAPKKQKKMRRAAFDVDNFLLQTSTAVKVLSSFQPDNSALNFNTVSKNTIRLPRFEQEIVKTMRFSVAPKKQKKRRAVICVYNFFVAEKHRRHSNYRKITKHKKAEKKQPKIFGCSISNKQ